MTAEQKGHGYLDSSSMDELVERAKKFGKSIAANGLIRYDLVRLLLLSHGLDIEKYPSDLNPMERYKVGLAQGRVSQWLDEEYKSQKDAEHKKFLAQKQADAQRELSVALGKVGDAVKFAQSKGMGKVVMGFLELFLMQNGLEFSAKTRRMMLAEVNRELKNP
jgi:hypothetical protein